MRVTLLGLEGILTVVPEASLFFPEKKSTGMGSSLGAGELWKAAPAKRSSDVLVELLLLLAVMPVELVLVGLLGGEVVL